VAVKTVAGVVVVGSTHVKLSSCCWVVMLTQECCVMDTHLYRWPSPVAMIWYLADSLLSGVNDIWLDILVS